jgi:glycosyltransferase A (GT-A) superfamily protein (DUF2064 family)
MRQGIIIFADAPAAGSAAEASLKATVAAALATPGATPFLAYGKAESSAPLRTLVGGPPPRFFPQAARTTLGERMAQAFAFLFVQDYERVALVTPDFTGFSPERAAVLLQTLDATPVAIEAGEGGYVVALRRPDFPQVAAIFEEVTWEAPGAAVTAKKLLDEIGAKA